MKRSIHTSRIIILFIGYTLFSMYYFSLHRIKKTKPSVKPETLEQPETKIFTWQHQQ